MAALIGKHKTSRKAKERGTNDMDQKEKMRSALPMAALDEIPEPRPDAKNIVGLIKRRGRITGYQLSDGQTVSKAEGVALAESGEIRGVGIAHRGDTRYLKALPDSDEGNNLSSLPSVGQDRAR